MGPAKRGPGRSGAAALVSVFVALVLALGPGPAGAATVTSGWTAKIGSAGANGTATIQGYATGTGGLVLKLAKLKPATLMSVTLYKGTCNSVGAAMIKINAVKTSSTGAAVRTSGLSATQINAIKAATKGPGKMSIRIGLGSAMKCGSFAGSTPPRTAPPSVAPLALVGLRYRLVDELGRLLFCDPDSYPVARGDESQLAQQHYPEIRSDVETYRAITGHLEIGAVATPNADQILVIYREWKMLRAVGLTQAGGVYRFDYIAAAAAGGTQGWHVLGTIDATGTISLERRDPSAQPPCPIRLARGTSIATPDGPMAVEDLPGRPSPHGARPLQPKALDGPAANIHGDQLDRGFRALTSASTGHGAIRPMNVPQLASEVRAPPGVYSAAIQIAPEASATAAE